MEPPGQAFTGYAEPEGPLTVNIEIRVRMTSATEVTRHLVWRGAERALCGVLTLRPPVESERRAPRCQRCERNLRAWEERQ